MHLGGHVSPAPDDTSRTSVYHRIPTANVDRVPLSHVYDQRELHSEEACLIGSQIRRVVV